MKQKDTQISIPKPPELLFNDDGLWAVCPNCGGKLTYDYDKERDRWLFRDECIYCNQMIYDEQKGAE